MYFYVEVIKPDTIFMGFNSVRFDDEFMRYLHYRNFYDPYEWHWQNGCSRWDLLDVIRMTRALRPEGIEWPVDKEGKPTGSMVVQVAKNDPKPPFICCHIPRFVETRGGEYFFMPSMTALRMIGAGSIDPT